MKSVGFIGLGAMGSPMARNLIKSGHPLFAYDISEAAVRRVVEAGGRACDSPKAMAAEVDVVITMLGNAQTVQGVLAGDEGFLRGSRPGQVVIDMSSVAPDSAVSMAKAAREWEVAYLDAPVSGGVAGAEKGTLTIMIGGDPAVVEEVKPFLLAMGKNLYHIGGVGAGDAMKLVNNMLLGINMAGVAEALTMGVKLGLDPQTMHDVIKVSSGRSFVLENKVPNFLFPGEFAPGFAIDLQYKDLGLALDTATQLGIPTPITALSRQLFEMARAKGLGREDITAVIKILEEMAGVEVRA